MTQAKAILIRRTQAGANWFFYIAGLSVVNSIIFLLHQNIQFVVGLGTTQVINALSKGSVPGIVLGVIVAGIFALFGVFARKGQIWAFWVGMVLYLLDGLLILLVGESGVAGSVLSGLALAAVGAAGFIAAQWFGLAGLIERGIMRLSRSFGWAPLGEIAGGHSRVEGLGQFGEPGLQVG